MQFKKYLVEIQTSLADSKKKLIIYAIYSRYTFWIYTYYSNYSFVLIFMSML